MIHERLRTLIQAHQAALETHPEAWAPHEAIIGVLQALDRGEITAGRGVYLLGYQAVYWADEPTHAALYRQAAADIRQMQREEH